MTCLLAMFISLTLHESTPSLKSNLLNSVAASLFAMWNCIIPFFCRYIMKKYLFIFEKIYLTPLSITLKI